jgi:hypothetical protein
MKKRGINIPEKIKDVDIYITYHEVLINHFNMDIE